MMGRTGHGVADDMQSGAIASRLRACRGGFTLAILELENADIDGVCDNRLAAISNEV